MDAPNLFVYDDYRKYLIDWFAWKQQKGKYSMRNFSKRAGFGAPNILRLIMDGKRNLSDSSAEKFGEELGFDSSMKRYFLDLVRLNQAKSVSDRMKYYQQLVRHPKRRKVVPLEQANLRFLRHWLAPVVYEMTLFPDFRPDAEWIAGRFTEPPAIAEIRRAMADLIAVGLVEELPNGAWQRTQADIVTGNDVRDIHMFAFHGQALAKASDALLEVPMNERNFQVLITAASRSALLKLHEWWRDSQAEVLAILEEDTAPKDEVYQISWQMFPLVRRTTGSE